MPNKGFRPLRSAKRLMGNALLLKRSKGNKKRKGFRPFKTAKRFVGNALLLKRSPGNRSRKKKFRPLKRMKKFSKGLFRRALMLKKN